MNKSARQSETGTGSVDNGQIIGAIIIQAKDRKQRLGESEKKIALVAAEFLGKQVSV